MRDRKKLCAFAPSPFIRAREDPGVLVGQLGISPRDFLPNPTDPYEVEKKTSGSSPVIIFFYLPLGTERTCTVNAICHFVLVLFSSP